VGPYVVRRSLAQRGEPTDLYVAHDAQLARDVVLKIVPAEARVRILREARALAAVDHHGIVRVHAIGEYGDDAFIAMEYVRGNDLAEIVQSRGQVHPARALRWFGAAADALAAAHGAGVVHRGLKPQNIIAIDRDRVKVIDFAMARRKSDEHAGGSLSHASMAYRSPEQLEHGFADEKSDIWALGCILFELTVGTAPFAGASTEELTAAIRETEPSFPLPLVDSVRDIVSLCLRKSSFARVGSMRELATMARESYAATPDHPTDPPPRVSVRPSVSVSASTPPPPPARELVRGRMKGAAIRAAQVWFARTYGAGVSRTLYTRASPELRAIVRLDEPGFGIIPSGWYDAHAIGELLGLLQEIASPRDADAFYEKMGAAVSRDNVEGIYRSLFRLVTTPDSLLSNVQRVWRTYFDDGTLVARLPRPGELELSLTAWSGHHPRLCRAVGFGLQHLLREVGWHGLVLERTACISDSRDATSCEFEGVYLPPA
jgi:predicted Ser/Thr protein kinase